jgi:hypothetical protein
VQLHFNNIFDWQAQEPGTGVAAAALRRTRCSPAAITVTPFSPPSIHQLMEHTMRLFLGIVLGAALTVGTAFIYDTTTPAGAGATSVDPRPMVNWDVVGRHLQELKTQVREQWVRLTAR